MQKEEGKPQASMEVLPQVLLTLLASVIGASYGMSSGHSAVLLPILQSKNSSLYIDTETGSWIASVYAISSPVGCLIGGLAMDMWGRKKMNVVGNIGMAVGWLLITMAQSPAMLIYGRILEGFMRSLLATCITVFLDELANPKYRGIIVYCMLTSVCVGILAISTLGAVLDWRTASGLAALPSLLNLITLCFVYESPTWFVKQNRMEEAERALTWLWRSGNEEQVQKELDSLTTRLRPKETHPYYQTSNIRGRITGRVKNIFKPQILKPFLIIHIFNIIQVPCGIGIFTYYTVDILSKTRRAGAQIMDDYSTTILASGVRAICVFLSSFMMLRAGRRKLAMISGILSSASALCLGIVLSLNTTDPPSTLSPNLAAQLTFALIIIYVGSMSIGFFGIPPLMIGETQPSHIRGFACGYIYTMNDLVLGGAVKMYPWMSSTLEIHGLFMLFGISCITCTVFVYLFLPETQGLTLQQIEDYFQQPNIMWITRNRYKNERKGTEDTDVQITSSNS